ncbi:amino acid ABC transporter permease [Fulvimarina sp. 2208YS6-2-32]|uniref:Amino acid ABC transporter permease n=1 Tax=Fulvimarina uroteuthidis TaxID=3098149 RepID=A0ABU5HZ08_9HYPH|nr:amino acid ABC transporter permease [Fulvimarina sp. 2208YS6-2-32]MDY8107798.1 amino acid ABC transporter permease [Fulvimarina sp. 2208YS6-2-32]
MAADIETHGSARAHASSSSGILNNPLYRSIAIQAVLLIALGLFVWWLVLNTSRNLEQANIASGFDFLDNRAGFDIGQSAIPYTSSSTYGQALLVGLVNTLIVAGAGIVFATIVGFIVGVGRLSQNFLVRLLSTVYVEIFRNIPPLLVILFWYFGVLSVLGGPRGIAENPFGFYITNRGLQTPSPIFEALAWVSVAVFAAGIVAAILLARRNTRMQLKTGERKSILWPVLGLVIGLPILAFVVTGLPATIDVPVPSRFNLQGGFQIKPEFVALFLALSLYTAAFIAEIVRAGILSVSKGQTEAASALGLRRSMTLRLVVVPQAFRVIIPPLTSQYLNLIKNSSLGLAIGYPELFAIGTTVLNQSGQSIEIIVICMGIYLAISIAVSIFMNWFNSKMALAER